MQILPTLIAAALVLLVMFFAVRSLIRKRRRGDCGCGCENCTGCAAARPAEGRPAGTGTGKAGK